MRDSLKLNSSCKSIRIRNKFLFWEGVFKLHKLIIILRFLDLNKILPLLKRNLVHLIIILIIYFKINKIPSILQLLICPLLMRIKFIRIIIVTMRELLL